MRTNEIGMTLDLILTFREAELTSVAMWKMLLFPLFVLAPSEVSAAVVTSGFAEWIFPHHGVFDITTEGPHFHAQGGINIPGSRSPVVACNPCEPGTLVDASAAVSGFDIRGGVLGAFQFDSADKILLSGPGQFQGTFDFSGFLCTVVVNPQNPFCAVKFEPLTGRGNILLEVFQHPDNSLQVGNARYTFFIPEPSTYLLVAPCLAILAGWYLLRNRTRPLSSGQASGR
jgi:hypothetical protein